MFASYVIWHYSGALKSGVMLFQNIIIFLFHFFSTPLLLKTYFSKFSRLGEKYKKGLDIESLLSTFLVNTLMRIVGALVRTILILIGLIVVVIATLSGILLMIAWLLFPLIIVVTLTYGLSLLL